MSTVHQQFEQSVEIERAKDASLVPQFDPTTPMGLIAMAAHRGASIEQMQQLFELKLRMEEEEAKKAFNRAMAAFKENPPRITKNVQKKAGQIDLNYASLDHICDAVIPALSKVGIRHSWRTKQDDGKMTVTCVLSHELGHSEETTMSGPYDASGSKNPIQAIASATSYLQRYTLLGAIGSATGGTDDDGVGSGKPNEIDNENFDRMCALIDNADTKQKLQAEYFKAIGAAQIIGDEGAVRKFVELKDKRFKELS